MKTDRYTRVLLTIIALALVANATRGFTIASAKAADTMKCEIVGTVKIEGKVGIDTFGNPVTVKVNDTVEIKNR